jgi:hypothetical protein
MSEVRAVLRTRLPKDVRVPATRGSTVPMATALSPATRHEWTSVPETRTMFETSSPVGEVQEEVFPSQRGTCASKRRESCSDGTCRRRKEPSEGLSRRAARERMQQRVSTARGHHDHRYCEGAPQAVDTASGVQPDMSFLGPSIRSTSRKCRFNGLGGLHWPERVPSQFATRTVTGRADDRRGWGPARSNSVGASARPAA